MVASSIPQNLVVKRRRWEKNNVCTALLAVFYTLSLSFLSILTELNRLKYIKTKDPGCLACFGNRGNLVAARLTT
jgi:hypothetical protein